MRYETVKYKNTRVLRFDGSWVPTKYPVFFIHSFIDSGESWFLHSKEFFFFSLSRFLMTEDSGVSPTTVKISTWVSKIPDFTGGWERSGGHFFLRPNPVVLWTSLRLRQEDGSVFFTVRVSCSFLGL